MYEWHPRNQNHQHVQLESGRAKACQVYPPALDCEIILRLKQQLTQDAIRKQGFIGVLDPEEDLHEAQNFEQYSDDLEAASPRGETTVYLDDVNRCVWGPGKVRAGK